MIAITTIKGDKLRLLARRGDATVELKSQQNVAAAESLQSGDLVFITEEGEEDLRRGVPGVVARVERVSVDYRRINDPYCDEWEIRAARVRLRFVGHAKLRAILGRSPLSVDAELHDHAIIG